MKSGGMAISFNLLLWSLLGIILGGMVLVLLWSIIKKITEGEPKSRFKSTRPSLRTHITRGSRAEFSDSWETDIRLTYKRFKEIYPYSRMTYREYKELQREKAFRRAVSSQKMKRMIR